MILRGTIQIGRLTREVVFTVCDEDKDNVPNVEREYNCQEAAKYCGGIDRKTFRLKARAAGIKKNGLGKYRESDLLKLKGAI